VLKTYTTSGVKIIFKRAGGGEGFFEKIYTPVSLDFSPKS